MSEPDTVAWAVPEILPLRSRDPERRGRWLIRGRIGAGGMGAVYLAEDAHTGAEAAVKVMSDALADQEDFRARFAREIEVLRRVEGPFVAKVLDGNAWDELPWVATEYIPGPDLARLIGNHGPLDTASWDGLATGLLSALTRLHAAGVVHRDVKPANILLASDGPKIIDFGVAQLADATALTATGTAFGTLSWLAPEQISGLDATPASDTFSAGAVLAYAATGRQPFGDGPPAATVRAVMDDAPDLEGIPEHARTVIEFLLDKDPTSRWTTGQAAEYLAGSGEPTVVDAHATRMWHHGELTQLLTPNKMARSPDLTRLDPPVVVPATRGRSWKRWAIGATAAATLAAAGLFGADLIRDTNTDINAVATPEPSTAEDSKDQARDTAQTETDPAEEQSFSADCAWEEVTWDQNDGSSSLTGACDNAAVEMEIDWNGDGISTPISDLTAVGTIAGQPANILTSEAEFAQAGPEDGYDEVLSGTFRGTFAGETLVAPWRQTRERPEGRPGYLTDQTEIGSEGTARLGVRSFRCLGPADAARGHGRGMGASGYAKTSGVWIEHPNISEDQIKALCGFLADGFTYPEYEYGM